MKNVLGPEGVVSDAILGFHAQQGQWVVLYNLEEVFISIYHGHSWKMHVEELWNSQLQLFRKGNSPVSMFVTERSDGLQWDQRFGCNQWAYFRTGCDSWTCEKALRT